MTTVGVALAEATERLQRSSDSPRVDAVLMLSQLASATAAWLFAHDDAPLRASDADAFARAVARRAAGEPVAYVLGEAGFYGRRFAVDARVLVPRPETEHLVTLALAALRATPADARRFCDVGTGSGILAVTLAAEVPLAVGVAIDVSPGALDVARANARAHGVAERIRFACGDALHAPGAFAGGRFASIVANLPYVLRDELAPAPDPTSFEPRLALDGGPDGLDAYRALLARAPEALAPGGTLAMEAGPSTAHALAELAAGAFPSADVRVHRDYAGLERVVEVRA